MSTRRSKRTRLPPPPPVSPARARAVLLGTIVVVLLVAAAAWRYVAVRGPASRPNVLLVTIDTLRWDHVGAYGARDAATPVLDGVAVRGARFETAIAQAPLTAPSHASILTGRIPPRHGVRDNGGFALPEQVPTLADAFRQAGYRTAAFVSGFPLERRFGFARGFDEYDDRLPRGDDRRRGEYVERRADSTTDRVLKWLGAMARDDDSPGVPRPWFVWVHYFDPHTPYDPPAADDRFGKRPYDGEIAFVDQQLGRLLAALDRRRTIVLVTADHGESLGEHGEDTHGMFLYDATLRVPWIMEGPGIPAGAVSAALARGVDVMPTLLDLAGVAKPDRLDGRTLAAAASGRALGDEAAYAESLLPQIEFHWAPLYAWRTPRWKVIDAPRRELYAIDTDPGEKDNRAAAEPGETERLLNELRGARRATTEQAAVAADRSSAERLRALGYVSGTAQPSDGGGAIDPKDRIQLANEMWRGLTLVLGDPPEAVRALSGVLAADPEVHVARRYLAMALANQREYSRAIGEIDKLVHRRLATADDYRLLGEWKRLAGDRAGAALALDEAERLDPSSPDPLLAKARAAMADGEVARAATTFERALSIAPGHPEALRGLGEVAMARGDLTSATSRFEQLVADDPQDADARVKLGVLRVRAGQIDAGLALFRDAVALNPRNGEALLTLGAALAKSGRPAEAASYFDRAIAAGARTPAAFNGLGAARMESGDRQGALAAFRASLAIDSAQPRIRSLVETLSRRGGHP